MKENQKTTISYESFNYPSPNGNIEGYAVIPQTDKPAPVIIFCRGGNRDYGSINEGVILSLMTPLALRGFAVVGTQYSGGPNSGGKDEYGGKDVADVFALADFIKKASWNIDHNKIGLFGISRGAMMGMQALRDGLEVNRAAFIGGLYDMQKIEMERPDIYSMIKRDEMFDVIDIIERKKRSAVSFADALPNIPYLLLHSRGDSKAPFRQAEEMKNILGEKGKLIVFEGDDHGLRLVSSERNKILADWFGQM